MISKARVESKDHEDEGGDGRDHCQIFPMAKIRSNLLDILFDRTLDVITSFTHAASLKVLNDLTEKQSLPLDRIMPVTAITYLKSNVPVEILY